MNRKTPRDFLRNHGADCILEEVLRHAAAEGLQLLFGAIGGDVQGESQGEAEHLHEALAVDAVASVVQVYREGLGSGQLDELLHIPDRAETNDKIFSFFHLALYKPFCFVYNEAGIFPFHYNYCIREFFISQLWALDDFDNFPIQKLAVLTKMNIAFYTLGCKTNQYETQAMERLLAQQGHRILPFEERCDCYVVNTCSVTAMADKKNRAIIRRCRREHPDAILGVCGCYSQHDAQQVRQLGADVVGGSGGRAQFLADLLEAARSRQYREHLDNALTRREFEVLPPGGLQERTRAMLKVQDGCTNFCTYCIIPYTRGPIRSAPLETAVAQARQLEQAGYREIVVTGIEIAGWGRDLPGKPPVWQLIAAICAAVPRLRIRLGSLEPRIITPEFVRALAPLDNLCPQFHLSMQSGCDTVLARMKRKYTTREYYDSLTRLRQAFPGCAITTDMIVGFPGETEEEFRQSLDFIRRCQFAEMHIFPYSRRPGTPAAQMPGQLGNAVKEARSHAAMAAAEEMSRDYRQSLLGTTQQLLVEGTEGGFSQGHAMNYVKIYLPGEFPRNEIQKVTVTGLYADGVTAERM